MATARDLISASLRKIGALAAGETAEAADAVDGLAELNRMLGTWNNDGLALFSETIANHTLTASKQSYMIGNNGSEDLTANRPHKILSANILDTAGNDIWSELNIRDSRWWADRRPAYETDSLPRDLYYNDTMPNGTLYFSPTPDRAYVMELFTMTPLAAMTLAGTVQLSPGYEDAIVHNLAVRLGPEYGMPVPPALAEFASRSLGLLREHNEDTPTMYTDLPAGIGRRYDARTGVTR